jgi:hypothetical protein
MLETRNLNYIFKEIPNESFSRQVRDKLKKSQALCYVKLSEKTPLLTFNLDEKKSLLSKFIHVETPKSFVNNVKKKSIIGKEVNIKVKFSDDQFFIRARVVEDLSLDSLYFVFTSSVYKAMERSTRHYKCIAPNEVMIKSGEKKLSCYDISLGGLSVLIKNKDSLNMVVGKKIDDLEILIKGLLYEVGDVKISTMNEYYKDDNLCKVGLKFVNIDLVTEAQLYKGITNLIRNK